MSNFGFQWVELTKVMDSDDLYCYEKLFYNHNIPLKFEKTEGFATILLPEKFLSIGREILESYLNNKLDEPLNNFESRKFLRRKKLISGKTVYTRKSRSILPILLVVILASVLVILKLLAWLKLIN